MNDDTLDDETLRKAAQTPGPGPGHLLADPRHNRGLPSLVDRQAFHGRGVRSGLAAVATGRWLTERAVLGARPHHWAATAIGPPPLPLVRMS